MLGLNARFEEFLGQCADRLQLEEPCWKTYVMWQNSLRVCYDFFQKDQNKRHLWLAYDIISISSSFLVHFACNLVLCDQPVIRLLRSIKERFFPLSSCALGTVLWVWFLWFLSCWIIWFVLSSPIYQSSSWNILCSY